MTCLPCAKEIINGFAAQAWKTSHAIALRIPELVMAERLKASIADDLLQKLIDADQCYLDAVNAIASEFSQATDPEYPPETSTEGL